MSSQMAHKTTFMKSNARDKGFGFWHGLSGKKPTSISNDKQMNWNNNGQITSCTLQISFATQQTEYSLYYTDLNFLHGKQFFLLRPHKPSFCAE